MKKSEIVRLIQTTIESHSNDPDANFGDGMECAERVLSAIERAGMLPPPHMEFQGPATEANCDPYKSVNKWEEE